MSDLHSEFHDSSLSLYVFKEPEQPIQEPKPAPVCIRNGTKKIYRRPDSRIATFTKSYQKKHQGSKGTTVQGRYTFNQIDQFLEDGYSSDVTIYTIKPKHIRNFLGSFEGKLSARTLQNKLSYIWVALEGSGRDLGDIRKPDNPYSSHWMGLKRGIRRSTKKPCDMRSEERRVGKEC